ncbi:ankyrin [Penicillium sp. IBT 35674x]|nr:ankyrin [Penicillium sp. IBT 35674x]
MQHGSYQREIEEPLAPSPRTPEGYFVTTPQSPGMCVSWNSSFPWLRFVNFLQSPQNQDVSSPSLPLFVDSSRHRNAITKDASFELMQRLSSIIPWANLQHPLNIHSGSRTLATLSILMPEMEQGQHDILSTNLSTLKTGLRDHLGVVLYLISNNLTSRDPEEYLEEKLERDDKLILKLLKDTGWDDLRHLMILLSTREPTAESITEKVFASALRSSDFVVLENMLRSGISLNRLVEVVTEYQGACFLTPLQFAAHGEGSVRLINLLIKYGADVDFSINDNGETALYYAINERNKPAVRALLLQGATVTWECARAAAAVKPGGMQALSLTEDSLTEDSLIEDMIKIYLEQDLDTEQDDPEILVPAVEAGNVPMIELFLARCAKVNGLTSNFLLNTPDPSRTTLLGRAVRTGKIDTVRLLTHVSIGTYRLTTPSSYVSPLALAVMFDLTDISEVLLDSGADIRAADEEEITLLERAVQYDNLALCQILIKHGAKVDRSPCDTQKSPSALMLAVQRNNMDTIDLLINSNARMNDCFRVAPDTVLAAAVGSWGRGGDEQADKCRR